MTSIGKPRGSFYANVLSQGLLRGIIGRIFLQALFFSLLIESVFLAEKFAAVFNEGVHNHVSAGRILLLLLMTSPEIFNQALAIALLIGTYRILLQAREERELLVMAGAGMGVSQIIGLLMIVALLAQAASLLVAGSLGPMAQYTQRVIIFDAQYRALRGGGSTGQFYEFPNHVVYAGRTTEEDPSRPLFIKQTVGNTDRIITADRATLEGPDAAGTMSLHLRDFLAYDFENVTAASDPAPRATCPGCSSLPEGAPAVTMRVRNVTQNFQLDQLLSFTPRGHENAGEWNLFELLGILPPPAPVGYAETKSLGERFARSMLCLVAPLLGGLAIAFTTRMTRSFALPLACVALLGLDLLTTIMVSTLAPLGNESVLQAMSVVALLLPILLIVWVIRVQRALVRPALGKP